jgi:hypothetical protein
MPRLLPSLTLAYSTDRSSDLAIRVHPLMPTCLFGVPSLFLPTLPFGVVSTAWVFFLLVTLSKASTYRSGSTPSLCSVLRLSQPLDGLLRFRCCGLISSHCHYQGSSVQGFLPLRSPCSSSLLGAPMPLACIRSPASRLLLLQGPNSEALLHETMRSSGSVFTLPFGRSLLRISPPSGYSTTVTTVPRVSAHDVPDLNSPQTQGLVSDLTAPPSAYYW